jgi:hypothetical protein
MSFCIKENINPLTNMSFGDLPRMLKACWRRKRVISFSFNSSRMDAMSPGGGIPSSLLSIDMECNFTEGFHLMRLVGS